jgi:hypothetical protein
MAEEHRLNPQLEPAAVAARARATIARCQRDDPTRAEENLRAG